MEKKLTKREIIGQLLTIEPIIANDTYVNFLKHELELLDKKSSNRKETQKQKENKELTEVVYSTLVANNGNTMSIKQIIESDDLLKDLSSNRVSAMLKTLVDNERVVRVKTNKGTFFTVAWIKKRVLIVKKLLTLFPPYGIIIM